MFWSVKSSINLERRFQKEVRHFFVLSSMINQYFWHFSFEFDLSTLNNIKANFEDSLTNMADNCAAEKIVGLLI